MISKSVPSPIVKKILLSLFLIAALSGMAQHVKDSCLAMPIVGINFSGQLPFGNLKKTFGSDLNVGLSFIYKTKKNYLIGFDGGYFFGRNLKVDVLAQMRNSDKFIADNEGYPADIRMTERGWNLYGIFGKVFSKWAPNPNSGIMAWVGLGYMQHKIKLYDTNKSVAAIKGDLKKGYDHLSGGIAMSQFLGYMYLSNNRLVNFYAGIEVFEGYTQSFRKYNYDTASSDTKHNFDILIGGRIGWILPLYKRGPKEFYYD